YEGLRTLLAARTPPRPYPQKLGSWPALALLLLFGWVELVFPFRAVPFVLAWLVLGYSALTFVGMSRYGPDSWLNNADPFHRLFDLLSRFAPFASASNGGVVLRPPAAGLMRRAMVEDAEVGFVIAMLAIVLFDGLQGSKHWVAVEDAVHALNPKLGDAAWVGVHTAGLIGTWFAFLGLYLAACAAASSAAGGEITTGQCARAFALTLIPIAVGYHFAHTFTYLLVQGQNLVFLVSDPLGVGWNLFGTRDATINIAVISTRTAWYLALSAIVVGHAISVYLAHVAAERMLQQ